MARRKPDPPPPDHELALHGRTVQEALRARKREVHTCRVGGMSRMLGTISPYSVTKRNNSKIVLLVRSDKLGTWFKVGVEMDKNLPGKAARIYVRPASAPEMIGRS